MIQMLHYNTNSSLGKSKACQLVKHFIMAYTCNEVTNMLLLFKYRIYCFHLHTSHGLSSFCHTLYVNRKLLWTPAVRYITSVPVSAYSSLFSAKSFGIKFHNGQLNLSPTHMSAKDAWKCCVCICVWWGWGVKKYKGNVAKQQQYGCVKMVPKWQMWTYLFANCTAETRQR